jgi:37-kD nucleoid-associated bacterial protein
VTILRRDGNLSGAPSASAPAQAPPAPETPRPSRQVEGPAILPGDPPVGRIHIERLILHSLNNLTGEMRLVDEAALLSDEAELFFSAHIEAATVRADWKARFMEPSGDVALLCRDLLGNSQEYVRASQQLARRLFTHMRPRTIAPGDFVALTYRRGEDPQPQIALFKLDPDHRLVRTFEALNGRMRVSINVVENLLPDSTRLQKCALLCSPSPEAEFEVTLLDNQAGPRADGVAAFFYRGFLMTELAPSPRRRTREFLRCCDLWLAAHQDECTPDDLVMFYQARRSALLAECLDCQAFADSALPDRPELQDNLLGTLAAFFPPEEGGSGSHRPGFVIDHSIADSVVRKVTLELDGGARLSVPADRFAELVRIEPSRTAENKYRLVIESSTLKEVSDR